MDIQFHGKHDSEEAIKSLMSIIQLLTERYDIHQFREMHLSLTLMDDAGVDVELVDSETDEAYRVLDVYRQGHEVTRAVAGRPALKLVIDNTRC